MVEARLVRRAVGTVGSACLLSLFAASPGGPVAAASAPAMTPAAALGAPAPAVPPSGGLDRDAIVRAALRRTQTGPVVGPEHPVSDPIESPSTTGAYEPAVAFDGTNHLVVWSGSPTRQASGESSIYAARVTPTGALLDPVGIALPTGAPATSPASVAFGGGVFLVVWGDSRREADGSDVYGARVRPDGTVLDPSGIPVSTAAGFQETPDVAFGDGSFLVAWSDRRADAALPDVLGARVSPSGAVVAPSPIAIATTAARETEPAVAYGGGSFLVVWTHGAAAPAPSDIAAARVDSSGSVLDPSGIPVTAAPGTQEQPDLAFNGSHHLVVWEDEQAPPTTSISAARVDPSGAVLDPTAVTVAAAGDFPHDRPAVSASGTRFLVAWYDGRSRQGFDAIGARIDADGTNLDPAGVVLSASVSTTPSFRAMALGSGGPGWFAVWNDDRLPGIHAFAAAVRPDATPVGPGSLVDRSANPQRTSAIAFDGTNYLVVWGDDRSGRGVQTFASRVSPTGRVLDPADILISAGAGPTAFGLAMPAVAFDGARYLVTWLEDDQVLAKMVTTEGVALPGRIAMPVHAWPYKVAVAFNGTDYLVTWSESQRGWAAVEAARVSPGLQLLDPAGIMVSEYGYEGSVASDGQDFLVTSSVSGLQGTGVGRDGSLISRFTIAEGYADQSSVAWNGQRYLVAWHRSDGGYPVPNDRIQGARVTSDAVVQDPGGIVLHEAAAELDEPVVAANGPFLVAWRKRSAGDDDLLATRVGDDGTVLDPDPLVLADSLQDEHDVRLSSGPGRTWAATYTRWAPEAPYGTDRTFLRTVAPK